MLLERNGRKLWELLSLSLASWSWWMSETMWAGQCTNSIWQSNSWVLFCSVLWHHNLNVAVFKIVVCMTWYWGSWSCSAEKPCYFVWLSMCTLCCCAGGPDSPSFCSTVWLRRDCSCVHSCLALPDMNPDIADYMTTFIPFNVGGRISHFVNLGSWRITFC